VSENLYTSTFIRGRGVEAGLVGSRVYMNWEHMIHLLGGASIFFYCFCFNVLGAIH